jgi:ABC-2 type transport system permease protein
MRSSRAFIIARRVITQVFRDKRTVGLVVFVPMLMMALGAVLFRAEPTSIPLGVVNEDEGVSIPLLPKVVIGELIEDELRKGEVFTVKPLTMDRINSSLSSGSVQGVIVFGVDFSREFLKNHQAVLDLRLEGSNPTRSMAIIARTTEASMKALAGIVASIIGPIGFPVSGGESKLPVTVISSYLYGGEVFDAMDYIAPVYIGLLGLFFVFLLTCVSFLRERSQGTMERLLATPATRLEIIVGYMMGLGLFALIQVTIILFFTVWVLNIHYLGNLGLLFIVVTILAVVGVSQGIVASVFARNEFQVIQFIPLLIFPQVLFGGTFWAVEELPGYLQPIAYMMPLTYANRALRDVMLKGWGLMEIWPNIMILLGFSVLFITIGVLMTRREVA